MVAYNASRKRRRAERVVTALRGEVSGKTIALLGLAFKPNTDYMREAPAIDIALALQAAGAKIRAFDPESMEQAKQALPDLIYCHDPYECVDGADGVAIVTEWDAFRALDLPRLKSLLKRPVVVDLRNIYRPERMRALGFDYSSIGRA